MFDMINIFEVFLPQLLRYPNPTDPLNGEAAALLMREPKVYDAKVKGIVSCLTAYRSAVSELPATLILPHLYKTNLTDGHRIRDEICQQGSCR